MLAVAGAFSAMHLAIANTVPALAILQAAMARRIAMMDMRYKQNQRYLAAISVASDMFHCGLVDEADYSALETKFAAKYQPLFRYEKPCLSTTLPIRQTDERRG